MNEKREFNIFVDVKCVGCGKRRSVKEGEVSSHSQPFKMNMTVIRTDGSVENRRERKPDAKSRREWIENTEIMDRTAKKEIRNDKSAED